MASYIKFAVDFFHIQYLAALLWYAFHDCDKGVDIRFRTSGGIFNLRRMNAKSLVSDDLVAHSLTDI